MQPKAVVDMTAEQKIRHTIGDLVIANFSLEYQVNYLSRQLADAQERIAELEAPKADE